MLQKLRFTELKQSLFADVGYSEPNEQMDCITLHGYIHCTAAKDCPNPKFMPNFFICLIKVIKLKSKHYKSKTFYRTYICWYKHNHS